MKILVTGCRGFLGGSLGRLWAAAGHELVGLGRASQPDSDWPGIYVQVDVAYGDLSGILERFRPDVVFQAAGTASVSASFETPFEDFRAQTLAWANLLDNVRRAPHRPVILFPSSAAVYGSPARVPTDEDAQLCAISPYGYHKIGCEVLAQEYARCFGLNVAICRIFSTFGARQRRLLIWEIYAQLRSSTPELILEGSGNESRDYICVEDLATALLAVAERRQARAAGGECLTVNIGSGEEVAIGTVASNMRARLAPGRPIRFRGKVRPGDPQRWCADVSRLRSLVPGWRPFPFEVSLARCIAEWEG